MTLEEFDALPDDGVDRWLIRGRLYERRDEGDDLEGRPMTIRGYSHSSIQFNIGYYLKQWIKQQPPPHGRGVSGEAGFLLRREPGSRVGIDVAYITAEQAAATPKKARIIQGPPLLAVEILSPSDRMQEVTEKIEEYIQAGVSLVWCVEPTFSTITVYRPDAAPVSFNVHDELTAEPHLPGLRVAVADIFE